ncbi:hypothetical protein Spb1_12350 [Planctopirus ephydatiae]|uniref:Uncharacterized protein n=1 Tax=Planctopirus ephydatiae TaxID=2528019 RepID=A0A518GL95_9PLAN|nr:hypothetical protein Spb1_12350 [Planctopirus ephydatiae]
MNRESSQREFMRLYLMSDLFSWKSWNLCDAGRTSTETHDRKRAQSTGRVEGETTDLIEAVAF